MQHETLSFKEFVPLALRTESVLDAVTVEREVLTGLLRLGIEAGDVLDVLKKSVFYKKPDKFDGNIHETLNTLRNTVSGVIASLPDGKPSTVLSSQRVNVDPRILHAVVGKFTEASELLAAVLKSIDNGQPLDSVNLAEELGDDEWYDAILTDAANIDKAVSRARVINKLAVRYPDKFTTDNATVRNLEAERKALEGK
jgi:hypothetical protein